MKKSAKALSILVIIAMLIALVPKTTADAATSYKLAAKSKYLFVGGCTGTKANGAKAPFKASYTIKVKGLKSTDKVTYTSKNKSIAKVTKKGKVTAVANGTTKIVVKIKTKAGKTYTRNFTAKVKSNAATVAFDGVTEGQELEVSTTPYTLKVTKTNSKGTKASDLAEFSIADTYKDIASVTADGKLTVKAAGEFKVAVKTYQSAKYPGTTASAEIKLVGKAAKQDLAVKQSGSNTVILTLPAAVESISKNDIDIVNVEGTVRNKINPKEVSLDTDKSKVI
ncbi:MAG: Ig-like domain-containing protein, partial [Lachnospiraceae bacterium]|nr:Ig-like domain-containing protein [Lachnospiraceae bacterium]